MLREIPSQIMAFESRRGIRFAAMEGALRRWVTFHFDTYLAAFRAFANTYWVYKARNPCYKNTYFYGSP